MARWLLLGALVVGCGNADDVSVLGDGGSAGATGGAESVAGTTEAQAGSVTHGGSGEPTGGQQLGVGGSGVGGSAERGGTPGSGGSTVSVDCPSPLGAYATCRAMDGAAQCVDGKCVFCNAFSLDCDGDPSNGCETSRTADHCMSCGQPCDGVCTFTARNEGGAVSTSPTCDM
jgi:hypothetical protein